MRKFSRLAVFTFFICWGVVSGVDGYQIKVLYFERPPYHMTTETGPRGIVMDVVVEALKLANVSAQYEVSSINRILYSFKRGDKNICSPGWFKIKNRMKFAKFSVPIFQNRPIVVLTKKSNKKLNKYSLLSDIFKDRTLSWGRIRLFSYGSYIDNLSKELKPNAVDIDGKQVDLIRMLYFDRFSYMLISPEEVDSLIKIAGFKRNEFMVVKLLDIPAGNKRYIMFSKDVPDYVIEKINRSILKLKNKRVDYEKKE